MRRVSNLRRYSSRRPYGLTKPRTICIANTDVERDKRNKGIIEFVSLRRQKRGRDVTPVIFSIISSFLRSFLYSFVSPPFLQALIGNIGGNKEAIMDDVR